MVRQKGNRKCPKTGIPYSTQWYREKGRRSLEQKARDQSLFTPEVEQELIHQVTLAQLAGIHVDERKVNALVVEIQKQCPPSGKEIRDPYKGWGNQFLRENSLFARRTIPCFEAALSDAENLCHDCKKIKKWLQDFPKNGTTARQLHAFRKPPDETPQSPCKLCHFVQACLRSWNHPFDRMCYLHIHRMKNVFGSMVAGSDVLLSLSFMPTYKRNASVCGWILPKSLITDRDNDGLFERDLLRTSFHPQLAKSWLEFCEEHHSIDCNTTTRDEILHFRLIDCFDENHPIIDGKPEHTYAALSYVWGKKYEDLSGRPGKLPHSAPLVVLDSLKVARELGIPYLWVDRYCVDQNRNSSIQSVQLENMHKVYQSAYFTIVAASGEGPEFGLPGVSTRERKDQLAVDTHGYRLFAIPDAKQEIEGSTWSTRAWVYQENLFSRRRLVFTESQIFFQCLSMHCCEAIPNDLHEAHTEDLKQLKPELQTYMTFPRKSIGSTGCELVARIQPYLGRCFTKNYDALNAFLGIFQAYLELQSPVHHFYGLPMSRFKWEQIKTRSKSKSDDPGLLRLSFLSSLSWANSLCDHSKMHPLVRRNGFPSWTWAEWKGLEAYCPQTIRSDVYAPSVEFRKIWKHGGNAVRLDDYWENLSSGISILQYKPSVYLQGWVTDVLFEEDPSGNEALQVHHPIPTHRVNFTLNADSCSNIRKQLLGKDNYYKVLLMGNSLLETGEKGVPMALSNVHAIILEPVPRGEPGRYIRLGVVTWSLLGFPSFEVSSKGEKMVVKELVEARRVVPRCGCGCATQESSPHVCYLENDYNIMEFRKEEVELV